MTFIDVLTLGFSLVFLLSIAVITAVVALEELLDK